MQNHAPLCNYCHTRISCRFSAIMVGINFNRIHDFDSPIRSMSARISVQDCNNYYILHTKSKNSYFKHRLVIY